MVRVARSWGWHYTLQFASGRRNPTLPTTKHVLLDGAEVSLCNRRPYWRLREDDRRWLADPIVLKTLNPCPTCEFKISKMGEK